MAVISTVDRSGARPPGTYTPARSTARRRSRLLEGLAQQGGCVGQGLVERLGADRQVVDGHPVEALGVLAQRGIAALLDFGEDLAHGLDRRRPAQVGAGQAATNIGAATAEVESAEH